MCLMLRHSAIKQGNILAIVCPGCTVLSWAGRPRTIHYKGINYIAVEEFAGHLFDWFDRSHCLLADIHFRLFVIPGHQSSS